MSDLETTIAETHREVHNAFISQALERAQHFVDHAPSDPSDYETQYANIIRDLGVAYSVLSSNCAGERAGLLDQVLRQTIRLEEIAQLHAMRASIEVKPVAAPRTIQRPELSDFSADSTMPTLYSVADLRDLGLSDSQIVGVLANSLTGRAGVVHGEERMLFAIPHEVIDAAKESLLDNMDKKFSASSLPIGESDDQESLRSNPALYLALGIEERIMEEIYYYPKRRTIRFPDFQEEYSFDNYVPNKVYETFSGNKISAAYLLRSRKPACFRSKRREGFYADDILFLYLLNIIDGRRTLKRRSYEPREIARLFNRSEQDIVTLIEQDYFDPNKSQGPTTKVLHRFREAYDLVVDALKEGKTVRQKYLDAKVRMIVRKVEDSTGSSAPDHPDGDSPAIRLDAKLQDIRFGIYTTGTMFDYLKGKGLNYYRGGLSKLLLEMSERGMAKKESEFDNKNRQLPVFLVTEAGLKYITQRVALKRKKLSLPEVSDNELIGRTKREISALQGIPIFMSEKMAAVYKAFDIEKPPEIRRYLTEGADYVTGKVVGHVVSSRLVDAINKNRDYLDPQITSTDFLKAVGLDPATEIPQAECKDEMLELKINSDVGPKKDDKDTLDKTSYTLATGIEQRIIEEGYYDRSSQQITFVAGSERVSYGINDTIPAGIAGKILNKHNWGTLIKLKHRWKGLIDQHLTRKYYATDILFLRLVLFWQDTDFLQRKGYTNDEIAGIFHVDQPFIDQLVEDDYFKQYQGIKQSTRVRQRFKEAYNVVVNALKEGKSVDEKYNVNY